MQNGQVPIEICEVNRQKAICITVGITFFNLGAYFSGKNMRSQPISIVLSQERSEPYTSRWQFWLESC